MTKKQREYIRMKFNNKCAYCGTELLKGWHVDELLPVGRSWRDKKDKQGNYVRDNYGRFIKEKYIKHPENFDIVNQMPACSSCNINKHDLSLEQFRSLIQGFMKHLNELNTQYKIAKRYGLVKEDTKPIVFYFEKNIKT